MTLTIGVAIPCYSGHAHYILPLLHNIASSTVKPDSIVISCSSWEHSKRLGFTYDGIPVQIWYATERLNVAQNRNRAASCLNTDLITFLDADDLMHPKRIEFLRHTLETRPDVSAVYHGYSWEHVSKRGDPFWEEESPRPLPNPMVKDPNAVGIMVATDPPNQYEHHHAHVTIRRAVFDLFRFPESWDSYRKEDSLYGAFLVAHAVPVLFLNNKLSRYIFN